jgi:predicted metal-dependent peptidase
MSAEEQRELARDIDEAVRQGALIASKLGSGGVRNLEDLLQPQVDWREVLREFVQNTCAGSDYSTWKRPNRRYMGAGIYMPSGVSDKVGELVIAID